MSVGWRGEVMINGGLSICIFPLDLIQSNMDMRPVEGASVAAAWPTEAWMVFHVVEGRGESCWLCRMPGEYRFVLGMTMS